MKNDIKVIAITLAAALICFVPLIVYEIRYDDVQKEVSRALNLNPDVLADGTVECNIQNYGFHGDGETFIQIRFDEGSTVRQALEGKKDWHSTPVPENLRKLANRLNGLQDIRMPADEEIGEGYFYFLDRHSDAKNRQDYIAALERYSANFTVSFYSVNGKTLWYCKFDS